ncbi:AAA family ATPase [Catenuloplanes japonicus]|uniref:AAA family ATPase n=1 Tax=Catenuloplanes japonicus TaxID=33876 RepID=UPI000527126F|nr:helix-turn-helix transcriptional regulator [Catenuloplanes japonicus]
MRAYAVKPGLIIGRTDEHHRVTALLDAARAGEGGALLLTGEAGIGKSVLLDHAARTASGWAITRVSGAEFEQELPFAGLHQLCQPFLGLLTEIPDRHREALTVAFGLMEGQPDLLRVGLAALELMTAAARVHPLLFLVDDAQWLDTASSKALVFLARRIGADPIAMVVAARSPRAPGELDTLPALAVGGLSDASARELLAARSPFPLDERVRDRLVAEAHGNPLALLELPRAGGFAPPDTVPARVEQGFRSRLEPLPEDARLLLTIAGADPTGDPGLLWAAARHLDLDVSRAGADAAATGLAEFDVRVRFCHPLARSAVYRAAAPAQLRAAHGALAEVTDPVQAPDRRAWHRARACGGPDDDVADGLERCAARAQARGGVAAAAAFLEHAAALSLDRAARTARTLAAAQAHVDAGGADAAATLLHTLDESTLDAHQLARADVLRGRIAFTRPGDETGPALMVRAARRLSTSDPDAARECLLDAVEMSLVVGRAGGLMTRIMATVRTEAPPPTAPDVLEALTVLDADGHRAAVPLLRGVLHGDPAPLWASRPALASMIAGELWDTEALAPIAAWLVKTGRESGSPATLRLGLAQQVVDAVLVGDVGRALVAGAEEEAIAQAVGGDPLLYHRLHLAAHRGRRDEVLALSEAATRGAAHVTNLHWVTAVLHNGLADYPAALAAARHRDELFLSGPVLPELIEAAVRCQEPEIAAGALDALTAQTEASGSVTGLGVAAYARGLVTGVEDHYREAVDRMSGSPLVPYRARAHLLYGEWLRRRTRRRDAVVHLRIAHDLLVTTGADAFARRAATELRATGERVMPRSGPDYETLTMQEIAVGRLVAAGATSKEVAIHLFISKRTVDAHLRNIFRKLGITSRAQLRDHPHL